MNLNKEKLIEAIVRGDFDLPHACTIESYTFIGGGTGVRLNDKYYKSIKSKWVEVDQRGKLPLISRLTRELSDTVAGDKSSHVTFSYRNLTIGIRKHQSVYGYEARYSHMSCRYELDTSSHDIESFVNRIKNHIDRNILDYKSNPVFSKSANCWLPQQNLPQKHKYRGVEIVLRNALFDEGIYTARYSMGKYFHQKVNTNTDDLLAEVRGHIDDRWSIAVRSFMGTELMDEFTHTSYNS